MTYEKTDVNPKKRNGTVGDCVVRAISIATGITWVETYDELCAIGRKHCTMPNSKKTYEEFLEYCGFKKHKMPKRADGKRYKVRELADEIPSGILLVTIAKHMTVIVDGVLKDTYDCGRSAVCNYWIR